MKENSFHPNVIYLDPSVRDLPVTKRVLDYYAGLPVIEVTNKSEIKQPQDFTRAKKQLYITRYLGDPLKSCQGMGDYVCCQYFTIALVSDCHLECTYCILQDYLANNPVITIYANTDEIFSQLAERVARHPERIYRIGTGELSDSLALDPITGHSDACIKFARENPNVVMELKTKTTNIERLLNLEHAGRVVVSWSVNPQKYIDSDEHKCAALKDRLDAARRVADQGYRVGFHFDPLLMLDDWQDEYAGVVSLIAEKFAPKEIAWISLGSLRFTPGLRKTAIERFPKSRIMSGELFPSADGKVRYFRPLREDMYAHLRGLIEDKLKHVPHYLCMETKAVWKNVTGDMPPANRDVEAMLARSFQV